MLWSMSAPAKEQKVQTLHHSKIVLHLSYSWCRSSFKVTAISLAKKVFYSSIKRLRFREFSSPNTTFNRFTGFIMPFC